MFGYERGAFPGAGPAKPGLFQVAHRGTIFLDEIGLLPEALQSRHALYDPPEPGTDAASPAKVGRRAP